MDDFISILENGISFKRGGSRKSDDDKVKTKANSGSAKQKAKYREQRANRHKGR